MCSRSKQGIRFVALDFFGQLIAIGLLSKLTLSQIPDLAILIDGEVDQAAVQALQMAAPTSVLLKWLNFQVVGRRWKVGGR